MMRTWKYVAASLMVGGAMCVGGCQSGNAQENLPPGENGSRAGGNGAFGSDVAQPGEGTHNMNGTGSNGTMPMNQQR